MIENQNRERRFSDHGCPVLELGLEGVTDSIAVWVVSQ